MKYIYTVKPVREAIKIAAESDDLQVDDFDRTISIHCIGLSNWPAGEKVERKERPEGAIRTGSGWWVSLRYCIETEETEEAVPLRYCIETEETEEAVPEFIKGLYEAMTENCRNVNCEDCPLHLINEHTDYSCSELISWTKKRWFS